MLPLLSGSFASQVLTLSFYGWVCALYLGLLSTVFGYLLSYALINRGAVPRLSIQLYLIPVVSVAGGAHMLGEPLTIPVLVGGGLIPLALGVTTWS